MRCPRCGYRQGTNWPILLCLAGFCILYFVWMLGDYEPREFRWLGLAAFLIFDVGVMWQAYRTAKRYREHRKLHLSSIERVKAHTRTD